MLIFLQCLTLASVVYWAVRRFVGKSRFRHVLVFGILLSLVAATFPTVSTKLAVARLQRERQAQRAAVLARITQAGGWRALQKECDEIANAHATEHFRDGVFFWCG